MSNNVMVRVGLPKAGYPVLFSANAFMRKSPDGVRVAIPKPGRLDVEEPGPRPGFQQGLRP